MRAVLLLLLSTVLPLQLIAGIDTALFDRTNLVAWCIVPFDSGKRTPEQRAAMLKKMGIEFAYDYRPEHIPTFDAEMEALKRHGVTLRAWWVPNSFNDVSRTIFGVLKRHRLEGTQIWIIGEHDAGATTQEARIATGAARLEPTARAAAEIRSSVALYNHGGWFGEPENQIAVIERLRARGVTNVGIVYNLHHGHDHLDRFAQLLQLMRPHLLALNLNGMDPEGDKKGRKILPLGQGSLDLSLLRAVAASGWRGPVGILCHADVDAEGRLLDNLDGLEWLVPQLTGATPGPKPRPRTWKDYWAIEDAKEREKLPLYQTIPPAKPEELTPSNNEPKPETFRQWHRSHGDNYGTRFSSLDQVNRQNVTNLQVAWTYQSRDASNNLQCNPIIVRGVMYAPTPGKSIVAVNVANGGELWRFKPEGRPAFRGLVYWPARDGAAERIFFCAGPWLYALDPATGNPVATFGETGRVKLPGRTDGDFGAATAAPAYFENILVVPGFIKDLWGFDAVTGKQLWTFHTVPHPGEFGYDTWDRVEEYGANCWGGMAMDEKRGIAYITTGSPKPNFIGSRHHGDNLFANCIIAVDARNGQRLWHFQEIRHDIWDLDIPAPPNLCTITRDGKKVDVVAAVTKIGNTLLLDRVTGKPIFPFRLRRAPTSDLRGEVTAPYQPDVELPEPFAKQEFTASDLTDRSEESADYAQTRFKSVTAGWFRPSTEGRPNLYFNIDGGAEWTGAAVDPRSARLYVTANHIGWNISLFRNDDPPFNTSWPMTAGRALYEANCAQCHATNLLGVSMAPPLRGLRQRLDFATVTNQIRTGKNAMPAHPHFTEEQVQAVADYLLWKDRLMPAAKAPADRPEYNSNGYPKFYDHEGYPANKPPWGTLNCIDLNTGKLLWKVPLGEYAALTREGMPKTGTENYGGAVVTAGGLVFAAGTRDHKVRAFDSDTGAELWSALLPFVGNAPPAVCEVEGRQYIIISASGANKLGTPYGDAYVAFALPARPK